MIRKSFYILVLILTTLISQGQQAPVTDQYILNPLLINPAYAGARGNLNIAGLYRRQWVGIEGAPETIMLTSDTPLPDGTNGIGLYITRDKIGVTRETSFSALYSYKIEAGEGNLYFGLRAGLIATRTKWSDLIALDNGDEFYLLDSKTFAVPDFSFGSYYTQETFFLGFSIPRLLSYRFNFDKSKYSVRVKPGYYHYLFHGGFTYEIAPDVKFLPSALLTLSPGERIMLDLNAHFLLSERIWAGASFRTTKATSVLFQVAVNNQLKVAYSYYIDFSTLGRFSNGSHEIMIRYEFARKADNVINPLIF